MQPGPGTPGEGPLPVYDSVTEYEKLHRVGEGTYGVVYKSRHTSTGKIVALKKVRFERTAAEGVPVTTVREIKILQQCLNHHNIVQLHKVVTGTRPDSLFMVFEYCDYDLGQLLDHRRKPWPEEDVKCLLRQLLAALSFLHDHWVVHRDVKLSNLLLTRAGVLKLCDFGLARHYHPHDQEMTPRVVTLWYRAPELLLGATRYTEAVDCWAAGCILGELLRGEPLFPAEAEAECLAMHCQLLGTPDMNTWPDLASLPAAGNVRWPAQPCCQLARHFPALSHEGLALLGGLLTYDPDQRLTARQALEHPYFKERPYPRLAHDLTIFPPLSSSSAGRHPSHQQGEAWQGTRGPADHHHHHHHHRGTSRDHRAGAAAAAAGVAGSRRQLDRRFAEAFSADLPGLAQLEQRLAKRRREAASSD